MAEQNNLAVGDNTNNPSTSQQNLNNDTLDDDNSVPSSAGTLQMSLLENRVETELTKMGKMMKDTVTGLTEHMNQRLDEVDRKFNNLLADLVPAGQNRNVNSSVPQPPVQPSPFSMAAGEPPTASNLQNLLNPTSCKVKPQNFSGATDFDEFLSQFEITSEINGWQYRDKSLYLANCLTGEARSLLSELDYLGRRDYKTLVEKLANRFGSVNRSEIFRTQLKSRSRNKGESIPELAQAIKKLVRQAYPGVNKDVIETLSIDQFVDALSDSDIRLRVREFGPKTLADAERTALRLESHKIADRQRSRLVGQIDSNTQVNNQETLAKQSPHMKTLQSSIDSLTSHVKDLKRPNPPNNNKNKRPKTWKSQNPPRPNADGRPYQQSQNNHPHSYNSQRQASAQSASSVPRRNNHPNQTSQNFRNRPSENSFAQRGWHTNDRNAVRFNNQNRSTQSGSNQGNWNRSGWRAAPRH